MRSLADKPESVAEYIAEFPTPLRKKLEEIRKAIRAAAPEAEERISFCIPMFAQEGKLAHLAAYKKRIGFHPGPAAIAAFRGRLSDYRTSNGTVQFPLDKPVPLDLVQDMIRFKVRVNIETASMGLLTGHAPVPRRRSDA
jgi:uncharacterized protein YdhG (YjbR/CyaY superfamily)